MPMEGLSPQNTLGIQGASSVAAEANRIEVNRDPFFKRLLII